MRFTELKLIIESHDYSHHQPRGGNIHNIFRKAGCKAISIPVHNQQAKRIYLKDTARKPGLPEDNDE